MKTRFLSGALALAVAVTALIGTPSAGMAAAPLWSVAVHLEYADGTAYDYVFARGVSASEMSSFLADCGASHRTGSVVRYHCYAIPE